MILRTGAAKESVLDRSVFKRLTGVLRRDENFAAQAGELIVTASSQASLNCRWNGFLAVMQAVNHVSAQLAVPVHIETVILLPAGSSEEDLRSLEDQIAEAAAFFHVYVRGGHTGVSEGISVPVVTVFCTGRKPAAEPAMSSASEDPVQRKILIAGWIAMEGTWLLAEEKYADLEKRFPVPFLRRTLCLKDFLSVEKAAGIIRMHDSDARIIHAGQGGIYDALWKLAETDHCGFYIDMKAIPVRQETIEISDYFETDPYQMRSGGTLVIASAHADLLDEVLINEGIPCSVAGRLTSEAGRILINGDERRYLNMPAPDSLLAYFG